MRSRSEISPALWRDPTTSGAAGVALVGLAVVPMVTLGALSTHMAVHILLMSVLAPIVAIILPRPGDTRAGALWLATLVQSGALWLAHAPPVHQPMHQIASIVPQAVLFALAVWFWRCVIGQGRWHAVAALLVTGKLACLLGALLIFAPRSIYASHDHQSPIASMLADQQLAGLLMIAACPLGYVLPAILLTARQLTLLGPAAAPAAR
jgi:putative membrane protein